MRKVFLTLIVSFLVLPTLAQEHMAFNGVSMDNDINTFTSELNAKGFKISKDDAVYGGATSKLLTGTFAGIDECKIVVSAIYSTKKVCKVGVATPLESSWDSVLSQYKSLKESFLQKYSDCEINSYEFGNGHNLQALKDGNCTYATYIATPQGKISLQIDSTYNKSYVLIVYETALNEDDFRRSKTNNNS